jgi:hypothetical protein
VHVRRFIVHSFHSAQIPRLNLIPEGARIFTVPAKRAVIVVMVGGSGMVATSFDRFRRQDVVEGLRVALFVYPGADRGEHGLVNLDVFVAKSGVVEGAEDVVHYFFDGNTRVFPCVENTTGWELG